MLTYKYLTFIIKIFEKTLITDFNSDRHYKFDQNYNYQIYNM